MTRNPSLTVFCGPMFSGKTSRLFLELERHRHQRKRVFLFKPQIDVRYAVGDVVSHSGLRMPATVVSSGSDVLAVISSVEETPEVVAVDEAFMLPGIADVLVWLYRTGVTVVASSLDVSATGRPFPEVERLLVWATRVEKCPAVCTVCGQDAFYTHKKQVSDDEIEVGGAELYEPRCMSHHIVVDLRDSVG